MSLAVIRKHNHRSFVRGKPARCQELDHIADVLTTAPKRVRRAFIVDTDQQRFASAHASLLCVRESYTSSTSLFCRRIEEVTVRSQEGE